MSANTNDVLRSSRSVITLPNRRTLVTTVSLLACAVLIGEVWNSLHGATAYGIVTGNITSISSPIEGVVQGIRVLEGDNVNSNDCLATISGPDYDHRLDRVAAELKLAESKLHAEIAKIQWQPHVRKPQANKLLANFHKHAGARHEASGVLGAIRNDLAETLAQVRRKAAKENELNAHAIPEETQQDRLTSIERALKVLKLRAENTTRIQDTTNNQNTPLIAKIDSLLAETQRIREWQVQGQLRAPAAGRVLKRHYPAGESINANEQIFSFLEESSVQVEMYLPQDVTAGYRLGDIMQLQIDPFEELVPCEVTQLGHEQVEPPGDIEDRYRWYTKLRMVRVRPSLEFTQMHRLTVGAVARLPRNTGRAM